MLLSKYDKYCGRGIYSQWTETTEEGHLAHTVHEGFLGQVPELS